MKRLNISPKELGAALEILGQKKSLQDFAEPVILPVASERMTPIMWKSLAIIKLEALERQMVDGLAILGVDTKDNEWPTPKKISRCYEKFCSTFYPDVIADVDLRHERAKIFSSGQAIYDFLLGPEGVYTAMLDLHQQGFELANFMQAQPQEIQQRLKDFSQNNFKSLSVESQAVHKFFRNFTATIQQNLDIKSKVRTKIKDTLNDFTKGIVRNDKVEGFMVELLNTIHLYVTNINQFVARTPKNLVNNLSKKKKVSLASSSAKPKKARLKKLVEQNKSPLLLNENPPRPDRFNDKKPRT